MNQNAPIETKVKAAGWAATIAAFAVGWIVFRVPALAGVAEPLQAAIVGVLVGAATAVAGWLAKHTPRYARGGPVPPATDRPYGM